MKLHSRIKKAWNDKYPTASGIEISLSINKDPFNKDLLQARYKVQQKIDGNNLEILGHSNVIATGHEIINLLTNLERTKENELAVQELDVLEITNNLEEFDNGESRSNSESNQE